MSVFCRAVTGLALLCHGASAQGLGDSAIAQLKQRIRQTSPLLASRRAELDVAIARRAAVGFRPAATLGADIEETPSVVNLAGAGSVRLDVSQALVAPSRRRAEQDLADRDVERVRLETEIAERALDASIDQLIARAAGGAAIVARLSSEDSLLRGAEEALRTRFAVGDARYVDVLRLRTERLRIETEMNRGRIDERLSGRQIVRLAPPSDSAELVSLVRTAIAATANHFLRGTVRPLPNVDSLIAAAATQRLAALAVERAEAARRLAIAEQRPSVTATVGLQRFSPDGRGASIGLTAGVSVPLAMTVRRANDARIMVADREIQFARAEQRAMEARLYAATRAAFDRYDAARVQIAAFDAALLQGARDEREAALASYRTGGMTLIELLDFERALAQAEVARIRGQIDAADALLDLLNAALGTDDVSPARHFDTRTSSDRNQGGSR